MNLRFKEMELPNNMILWMIIITTLLILPQSEAGDTSTIGLSQINDGDTSTIGLSQINDGDTSTIGLSQINDGDTSTIGLSQINDGDDSTTRLPQIENKRVPPTIIKYPEPVIDRTSPIYLPCQATGHPNPTMSLRYSPNSDGPWVEANDIELNTTTGSFQLENPDRHDKYYQCSAKNDWGTALSSPIRVIRPYISKALYYATKTRTEKAGEPAMVYCEGYDSKPPPEVFYWEQSASKIALDSPRIILDDRRDMDQHGTLVFAYLNGSDFKIPVLKCKTKNRYLDEEVGIAYVEFKGDQDVELKNTKPETLHFTTDTVALKGKNKILECFFSGIPAPIVTWSKSDGIPENASPQGRRRLVFENIDFINEGEYTCTGNNSEGSAEKTLNLTVEASPYWESEEDKPRNLEVAEGGTAEFNCKPAAVPEAKVVWMKNGEVLDASDPGPKIQIHGSKLVVKEVCKNCDEPDLANYQCEVRNKHGFLFENGYLNVLGKIVMTVKPQDRYLSELGEKETKKIELLCDAKGDPLREVEFFWFKDDQEIHDEDNVTNIDKTTHTLTLFLEVYATKEEMYDALVGIYRCQATNGLSSAFAEAAFYGPRPAYLDWLYLIIAAIVLLGILVLGGVVYYVWRSLTEDYSYYSSKSNSENSKKEEVVPAEAAEEVQIEELPLDPLEKVADDQANPSGKRFSQIEKRSKELGQRPSKLGKRPSEL